MRLRSGLNGVAVRWMLAGEWRAHPARVLAAILAVAVGVALGLAVHLVNLSALNEFGRAIRSVNGEADLQVRAVTPAGFSETLYSRLARFDGIEDASPVVEYPVRIGRPAGPAITLLGLDVMRAARVTPSLASRAVDPAASPFDPAALFLSQGALAASGLRVGDRTSLTAAGRRVDFVVAGTLPVAGDAQRIGVVDIATAQWRFGQLGRLQRIDLKLAPGVNRDRAKAALRAMLPPDAQLATPQTAERRGDSLSRAYRVNLEMLAMVALLTGGFLVYSAQALSVARRGPQFALLRVLGLPRGGLLGQIAVEGVMIGLLGGLLGNQFGGQLEVEIAEPEFARRSAVQCVHGA